MNQRLHREDLSQVACDYVAGDLPELEAQAFRELLPSSEHLQREVAFWQTMQPQLTQHGRPANARPPGKGFNMVLRERLRRESVGGCGTRSWLPNIAAAVAAAVLLTLGLGLWAVPLGSGSVAAYAAGAVGKHQLAGMEAVPARATIGPGRVVHGLQVVQVQAGGPADRLGIRPGDMILAVDGQSVRCPRHFAAVIAQQSQGSCRLRVYRPQMQRSDEYELRLDLAQHQ